MTQQPLFGHPLPSSTTGKELYIKSALQNLDAPTRFADIKDCITFTGYNMRSGMRKDQESDPIEVGNVTDRKELTCFGPYSNYSPIAATDLGQFFGRKNYAVRHRPEWTSEEDTQVLINDQKTRAKPKKNVINGIDGQ
jgi:hypothetical protein